MNHKPRGNGSSLALARGSVSPAGLQAHDAQTHLTGQVRHPELRVPGTALPYVPFLKPWVFLKDAKQRFLLSHSVA